MARNVFGLGRASFAWLIVAAGMFFTAGAVRAAVIIDISPGYSAPPSTLGGYTMSAFGRNLGSIPGTTVSSATDLGLTVGFSGSVTQTLAQSGGWTGWSHGYTGTVWHTTDSASKTSVTLNLPTGTKAFYLYVMPGLLTGSANVTIDTVSPASNGPLTQLVNVSSGAHYFGAYVTDSSTLTQLSISVPGVPLNGFAFGEFGINNSNGSGGGGGVVPEPTSMAIFGLSGLAFFARRSMAKIGKKRS